MTPQQPPDDVAAGEEPDEPAFLDHRQALDFLADHPIGYSLDRFVGTGGEHAPLHDVPNRPGSRVFLLRPAALLSALMVAALGIHHEEREPV